MPNCKCQMTNQNQITRIQALELGAKILIMNENFEKETRYFLGIDWGASRVGLAIADGDMRISTGLEEVGSEHCLERIKELDSEYDFQKIVVGRPAHKEFSLTKNFNVFLDELEKMGKQIELENENFSTKLAQANLLQKGKKGFSKNDNIESARLILQGFLDKSSQK